MRTADTELNAFITGGTLVAAGGYYTYTFNGSGTIKWGV
jgi:hypothetical protein